ncbi:uncharacterized protein LOC105840252 [Monomorium pharaonis]|uniref:uncharacterized protein LOC105840252 n=1 Tax=Monomorium pharaonis TaxID=307658 RepID=UPI00063F19E4|nr:uncharacterized protein LOC105840252 [Monomorium pharaonis]
MQLHQACRIVLILAILAVTCEFSLGSKQCKTIVMDIHMKRCRLGAERTKRGLEKFDLQKYDEKYGTKRQEESDYSKMKVESHTVPQKRQLSPIQVSSIALPIVTGAINGAAKARSYSISGTEFDLSPGLMNPALVWPGYYLRSPYSFGGTFSPFSAPANDDLDLYLNNEELDELYNDIYERLPRAPKEEAWKVFLETASKCCQNVDKCLKETMYVPCLGNKMF